MSKATFENKNLSPRQLNLLFAVVKEYCEFGEGVGSKEIKAKYNFNFSSATIRNELIKLRDHGYLYQPFTNAPSIPTEKAYKVFINQLIAGLQVTNQKQKELKKHIQELEKKQLNMNKEISRLLAMQVGGVGFTVDRESEFFSGISNLLGASGEGKINDILNFLENFDKYKVPLLESNESLIESNEKSLTKQEIQDLKTIIGGDNPVVPLGKGYAMIATEVYLEDEKTVVGIIAPTHLVARKKNLELMNTFAKTFGKGKK